MGPEAAGKAPTRAAAEPVPAGQPERLELQLRFLTERYAPHCSHWQFVVWYRQLGLQLCVYLPVLIEPDPTGLNDPAAEWRHRLRVFLGVGLALLVLLVALGVHIRTQPYPYRFQNHAEAFLYVLNVLMLMLGVGYSAGVSYSAPGRTLSVVETLLCAP